jgi:hypothetical protein
MALSTFALEGPNPKTKVSSNLNPVGAPPNNKLIITNMTSKKRLLYLELQN